MIQLFAAIILATVDVDSHHGSKDIESADINSFFESGIQDTCNSVYTFGAKSHSKDVIKKFEENGWNNSQWWTSLFAPYAAWYERVYYGNCGPFNNWTQAEFGGMTLPNISWNIGMDSEWAYVYKGPRGTNYYPHVLTPNVTRRLTEWESLMDLQDGVREFCDGREAGTPIMTRGRYWRGGNTAQGFDERRIYWSSQHLTNDEDVISVGWTKPEEWSDAQELSLKFMPIGALAPGATDMHNDRFSPTPGSKIPPRVVAETISRTYPNGLSGVGYNSVSNTFEDNISLYFGLNESGCTNPLRYNDWRLRRIVNDYYGMYKGLGTAETNFVYYSSNVAAASRALAMLDRTYEIVNENYSDYQSGAIHYNDSFQADVEGTSCFTTTNYFLVQVTDATKSYLSQKLNFVINPISDGDISIYPPNAKGPTTISVSKNNPSCDRHWDYAYCSGGSLEYDGTEFRVSTSPEPTSPGEEPMPPPSHSYPVPVSQLFTYDTICSGGTDCVFRIYWEPRVDELPGTPNQLVDIYLVEGRYVHMTTIARPADAFFDIPFKMKIVTKMNIKGEYNYEYSKPLTQALANECWNYAGPSSLAYSDGRVDGARMHYGAGVFSRKNVESEPRYENLTYSASEYGVQYKEYCAMFANRNFSSMLGWRNHLLDIRNSIMNRVLDSINSWYSVHIDNHGAFIEPLLSASNFEFGIPFATIPNELLKNHMGTIVISMNSAPQAVFDHFVYVKMHPTYDEYGGYAGAIGTEFLVKDASGEFVPADLFFGFSVGVQDYEIDQEVEPPTVKSNLPNSWSAAADSKNAIVIETDWKWKNLGWGD